MTGEGWYCHDQAQGMLGQSVRQSWEGKYRCTQCPACRQVPTDGCGWISHLQTSKVVPVGGNHARTWSHGLQPFKDGALPVSCLHRTPCLVASAARWRCSLPPSHFPAPFLKHPHSRVLMMFLPCVPFLKGSKHIAGSWKGWLAYRETSQISLRLISSFSLFSKV